MREFTLSDLKRIMRSCAGETEAIDLDGDILDDTFEDLGYDSLAILELCGRIESEFEVPIPDDAVEAIPTPRQAVVYFNEHIRAGG